MEPRPLGLPLNELLAVAMDRYVGWGACAGRAKRLLHLENFLGGHKVACHVEGRHMVILDPDGKESRSISVVGLVLAQSPIAKNGRRGWDELAQDTLLSAHLPDQATNYRWSNDPPEYYIDRVGAIPVIPGPPQKRSTAGQAEILSVVENYLLANGTQEQATGTRRINRL